MSEKIPVELCNVFFFNQNDIIFSFESPSFITGQEVNGRLKYIVINRYHCVLQKKIYIPPQK